MVPSEKLKWFAGEWKHPPRVAPAELANNVPTTGV
jgi:hypothetical protein